LFGSISRSLVGELRGKRLVGQHHERWPLQLLGEPGDGRRLAGAGGAEQHGVLGAGPDPLLHRRDRLRLITRRDHVLMTSTGRRGAADRYRAHGTPPDALAGGSLPAGSGARLSLPW